MSRGAHSTCMEMRPGPSSFDGRMHQFIFAIGFPVPLTPTPQATTMSDYALTDLALACRLERAEASANAAFVESRARLHPTVGATWIDVDGAYAMFDGIGSPLTQSFGYGTVTPPTRGQLETLDAFFTERGAIPMLEVSPLIDQSALGLLSELGLRPIEVTSVMHRPLVSELAPTPHGSTSLLARQMRADEAAAWDSASISGWNEVPELADFLRDIGRVMGDAAGVTRFLAESEGQIAATGSLAIHGRVAIFAGASTLPELRGRGAQSALLSVRLEHAVRAGCDLAMMCAAPGSGSQRNAERSGFRIAYTRTKWGRS